MLKFRRISRVWLILGTVTLLALPAVSLFRTGPVEEEVGKAKGVRRSGVVLPEVVRAAVQPVDFQASISQLSATGFTPQVRLGFTDGDQWEPAIAADRYGHIYVLYPQYLGVPGCPDCASPTMILQISSDRGASWGQPAIIYPEGRTTGEWDAQITVDPLDGRTVYAAWLQNGKSDTLVAKSTDFGATWTYVVANHTNAGTDKPILVVRGPHVYVAYNHSQRIWVSASHDGGQTFTSVSIKKTGQLGWALASGGTVDPQGSVYIGWAGYEQNGGAKGPVNLFISKSVDGGSSWTNTVLDISGAPPDCSAYYCGWAYLGAQVALAADESGTLYALWNAGPSDQDKSPQRMYFSRSTDGGSSWMSKQEVSTAPIAAQHAFPAVTAGRAGDVRIAWMDTRAGIPWNTIYRASNDSGASWSAESDLSTFVEGYDYILADGFSFPFGDYFEMDIDDRGNTQAVWGEGLSFDSPGSIWYAHGR